MSLYFGLVPEISATSHFTFVKSFYICNALLVSLHEIYHLLNDSDKQPHVVGLSLTYIRVMTVTTGNRTSNPASVTAVHDHSTLI